MKKLIGILIGIMTVSFISVTTVKATEVSTQQSSLAYYLDDRIELMSDKVTINVGQEFNPGDYAKAYLNGEEIPYNGFDFMTIVNEVDTTQVGAYTVIYRLNNFDMDYFIDERMTVVVEQTDRIDLSGETVILEYGETFRPELYAKAYRNGEEIPYDGHEFVAIQQEVDTSKRGEYQVVYRLHNGEKGTYIDQPMTVIVKGYENIETVSDKIILHVGDTFKPELYAKAYRDGVEIPYDGHEFVAIQQEVDTSKAGVYLVVYRLHNGPEGTHVDQPMIVVVEEKNDVGDNTPINPNDDYFNKPNLINPGNVSNSKTPIILGNQLSLPKGTVNRTIPTSNISRTLPKTGEKDSIILIILGVITILSGIYIFNKKELNN